MALTQLDVPVAGTTLHAVAADTGRPVVFLPRRPLLQWARETRDEGG